ncbi:MAG: ribonuclease E/G [Opitutaceae bacterium]|nr:ribonuclease E/G [Opitutaceae bacterium]
MPNTQNKNHNRKTQPEKKEDKQARFEEELRAPPREKRAKRIPAEDLEQQAKKREKDQPFLKRIAKAFSKEEQAFKELIINAEPLERRLALLEDGKLEKFEVEKTDQEQMVHAIFKGKIQNLEPGIKAAFVDIGQPKNAFLHYWDIVPQGFDEDIEEIEENQSKKKRSKRKERVPTPTHEEIQDKHPIGSDIVVQITKGQIGTKGPRTTTNIALPGRFLVLMPYSDKSGISKKIEDIEERKRLKQILAKLSIPRGMGVVLRTAGEGKKARYFVRDLELLEQIWEDVARRIEEVKDFGLVYREPDLIGRTVREFLTDDIDRVLIDNEKDHKRILTEVAKISRSSKSKVALFEDDIPIFERFNIERQIEETFARCVPLPSGGEIVIEETEALTAIDVNTGGHRVNDQSGKNFILQVNLEAAREAARQVSLRNIGGLIIIDFIDMKRRSDRNAVYNQMRREMENDRARSHILRISQLGILQMTRQRHQESNYRTMFDNCPNCRGRGIVKSARTVSVEIQRRLTAIVRRVRSRLQSSEELHLRVMLHPKNLERLRTEDEKRLVGIEQSHGVKLSFLADPNFHPENFKIINVQSGEEIH